MPTISTGTSLYVHLLSAPYTDTSFVLTIEEEFVLLYGINPNDCSFLPPHLGEDSLKCYLPGGVPSLSHVYYLAPPGKYGCDFLFSVSALVVATASPFPPRSSISFI